MIYHNEIDAFPAQWLRNLADAGLIDGPVIVDERSIADVQADDVAGTTQAHFFSGIGGWTHALRLAGWPATRPVWTGSCPCQPFSNAGKRRGAADERHLWPEFARLIGERRPPIVFGEQVASRAGRDWLAGVRADLEAMGYAVGAADLCAAGVGAPHIRQRLYWGAVLEGVDDSNGTRHEPSGCREQTESEGRRGVSGVGCEAGGLADGDQRERGRIADGEGGQHDRKATGRQQGDGFAKSSGAGGRLADTTGERCGETRECEWRPEEWSPWLDAYGYPTWLECLDGKWRRIPAEPEFFPLAHGVPGRVGRLRAYGNGIVQQVAATFVMAFMEAANAAQ